MKRAFVLSHANGDAVGENPFPVGHQDHANSDRIGDNKGLVCDHTHCSSVLYFYRLTNKPSFLSSQMVGVGCGTSFYKTFPSRCGWSSRGPQQYLWSDLHFWAKRHWLSIYRRRGPAWHFQKRQRDFLLLAFLIRERTTQWQWPDLP